MGSSLDKAMWEAWKKIEDKVLGDEQELRRRLARRERTFDRAFRPLCIAIRASDRRITPMTCCMFPRWAMTAGEEVEHDVLITSQLMRELARPVEVEWGMRFGHLAKEMGCHPLVCEGLERRGILRARRIQGLGGHWGRPYPIVDSPHAPVLDPGAAGKDAPDEHLLPFWRELGARLPNDIEQTLRRKPLFRIFRGRRYVIKWRWICPGCNREVQTIFFPMGAPNWARAHNIKLPEIGGHNPPYQPGCFACGDCHRVYDISRTERSISNGWSNLIMHMSGGLLYGREVKRPASYTVVRKIKPGVVNRSSPRRDELERYLATTDLPPGEIARRMGWTEGSVTASATAVYKRRGIARKQGHRGSRAALQEWWSANHPADNVTVAA